MSIAEIIGVAALLVLVIGPLWLGIVGMRGRHARDAPAHAEPDLTPPRHWRLTAMSALLYTLAFNLTFFIQELFLVLPKAFTPGLRPTLFHNNHDWDGTNPLAALFQGTGALAILLTGLVSALLLKRVRSRARSVRLFIFWMAYCGCFMALPQVVIGAVSPRSDVGMAMSYLGFGDVTKAVCALAALGAIPLTALWLRRPLFDMADSEGHISSGKARARYVLRIATLPSFMAIPLIVAFRVPREWVEVVAVPLVVTAVGVAWIQSGAWRFTGARSPGPSEPDSIAAPLGAVVVLLLIFQLLLRPGIRFY